MKKPCSMFDVYSQNTHTSCVYIYIKFSGLSPIYPNVTLRSLKVVLKKLAKKCGYVPSNCHEKRQFDVCGWVGLIL